MFKKIKSYFYGLFYGLKQAENEMFVSKNSSMSDTNITCQIKDRNVGKDLLKGEVTQEVEDLRYSTYAVYRESGNYEYVGDGVSVKKEKGNIDLNNFSFIQRNKIFCKGLNESFNEENVEEEFTLKFVYNDVSRFKLERYVEYITINFNNGISKISLRFNKSFDINTPITKMFYNELMKIETENIKQTAFYNNISSLCFTTYKAQGEDDFVMYMFSNLKYKSHDVYQDYIVVTYFTDNYFREDLTQKFFSKNQQERYELNTVKNDTFMYNSPTQKFYCSECNEEMNKYDYNITKHDFGRGICIKCLENYLTFDN